MQYLVRFAMRKFWGAAQSWHRLCCGMFAINFKKNAKMSGFFQMFDLAQISDI
jgi:hypothetical protein